MALWTEAEDATLKQMYEQEYSCSQIAGRLSGKTRNAVIGRVHRLGLPRRGAGIAPARARKERRERSPRSKASFICWACSFRLCMASMLFSFFSFTFFTCSRMMEAERRCVAVK